MVNQPAHLLQGFDALGDHAHLQRQTHRDDGLRQFFCVAVLEHVLDEGLINLQALQRQLAQITER